MSIDRQLLELGDQLRTEGVAIGTSELLDAFAVLGEIDWREREPFQQALAATLAKSQDDRRIFELVFERYFFRQAEAQAAAQEVTEGEGLDGAEEEAVEHELEHAPVLLALGQCGGQRLAEVLLLGPADLLQGQEGVEDLRGTDRDAFGAQILGEREQLTVERSRALLRERAVDRLDRWHVRLAPGVR